MNSGGRTCVPWAHAHFVSFHVAAAAQVQGPEGQNRRCRRRLLQKGGNAGIRDWALGNVHGHAGPHPPALSRASPPRGADLREGRAAQGRPRWRPRAHLKPRHGHPGRRVLRHRQPHGDSLHRRDAEGPPLAVRVLHDRRDAHPLPLQLPLKLPPVSRRHASHALEPDAHTADALRLGPHDADVLGRVRDGLTAAPEGERIPVIDQARGH